MSEGNVGGRVQLADLTKRYGASEAVRGIDLDIPPGEFFCLLGPSGCGKTTTLRMIAGFERPTGGRVLLDGKDVSGTPPNRRNVNTVFQNYALFSHLTVAENVAFGLRFTRTSKDETRTRVGEALSLVQMQEFSDRKPHQLSGGQQQRVALARALILNPSVLLLDEPLGALDAKLRKTLQLELKALQEQVGVTFVYVTHDQEEALTMADRLAVMSGARRAGRLSQGGLRRAGLRLRRRFPRRLEPARGRGYRYGTRRQVQGQGRGARVARLPRSYLGQGTGHGGSPPRAGARGRPEEDW